MGSQIVFAVYRPNSGKKDALLAQVRNHVPTLRKLGLATNREQVLVAAKDGTFIEIFEWKSEEASRAAHEHPEVAKIWEAMGAVCSFVPFAELAEAQKPFCHFTPVAIS